MDSSVSKHLNFCELVSHLQKERLLVNADLKDIDSLNEKITHQIEELSKVAWINTQQRINLNSLIIAQPDYSPGICCQRANSLTNRSFIPAKEVFNYQVLLAFSELFELVRSNPEHLAQWLVIAENISEISSFLPDVLNSLAAGLYGSFLLPEDANLMLTLLRHLAKLQLTSNDNPRRLLRNGSSTFSKMYFLFHDGLFPAKTFLTAALHNPIIQLIANTEGYLDIDPDKMLLRFSQSGKLEKFGSEDSPEYRINVEKYRSWVINSLVKCTNRFICSLQENIFSFPSVLAWLVCQIAHMTAESYGQNSKEVNAISTDLIFTSFICPAIVHPERYGVCDAPISEITRHNLMQIGQILQMLALIKFESPEKKLLDVYNSFDKNIVLNVIDSILKDSELSDEIPSDVNDPHMSRTTVLFTEQELHYMVTFLQKVNTTLSQDLLISDQVSSCGERLTSLSTALSNSQNNFPQSKYSNSNGYSESPKKSKSKSNITKAALVPLNNAAENEEVIMNCKKNFNTRVIIIPLPLRESNHIGFIPEKKVLLMDSGLDKNLLNVQNAESEQLPNSDINAGQEKRTRFCHSHDEGSIGNTSDNLEAISEAASNHSVDSSIELENEDQNDNDNLSDMVSANVSGRGTPNISGRDTPSSQVNENEDGRSLTENRQSYLAQSQPLMSKQIRSEIDDKFCKFEIKKLLEGDETRSIISDTWSTDVLASDSETIDAGDNRNDHRNVPFMEHSSNEPLMSNPLLDISETQSESAWSTDVLASDSERLTEVDNDDIMSVGRSDDMASLARSDDIISVTRSDVTRSEVEESQLMTLLSHSNNSDLRINRSNRNNSCFSHVSTNTNLHFASNFQYGSLKEEINHRQVHLSNSETGRNILKSEYQRSALEYIDNNANNLLNNSSMISENVPVQNTYSVLNSSSEREMSSNLSKPNHLNTVLNEQSNLDSAGPSRSISNKSEKHGNVVSDTAYLLVNRIESSKFDRHSNDIQLSNTSLNSSSSGSSSNSSEAQNKTNTTESKWKGKKWINNSETSLNITTTPSESTRRKSATVNIRAVKPSASTGAIPKSISFDMSADKGDRELDDDQKSKRGGFFGKLRMGFRNRRGKSFRSGDDYGNSKFDGCDEPQFNGKRNSNEDYPKDSSPSALNTETSEDILAKYRGRRSTDNDSISPKNSTAKSLKADVIDERLNFDQVNVENSFAFEDAKRKLRLVLSCSNMLRSTIKQRNHNRIEIALEAFLQMELAKAQTLKQWSVAARTAEVLRCIRRFDTESCRKLCQNLWEDHRHRAAYTQYLMHSRQLLLAIMGYLDGLKLQLDNEKVLCSNYLVSICVKMFLERKHDFVQTFCDEFQQLTLADEKNDHLNNFLGNLRNIMKKDSMWQDASKIQLDTAQIAIERFVMNEVYLPALYPNGDGDRHRDQLLNEHITKLSHVITPDHKDLMIDKEYQYECPWLPAQEALQAMAAFRTPQDKIHCITRCASCIMDFLSVARERGVPTADDFTPVLVYVIIKVNPPDLLSTIQYVNSFYNNRLGGETQYWWTQFCAAVEFIKTMDYND